MSLCPAGFYGDNSTNLCQRCNQACQVCQDDSVYNCALCNSNYYSFDGACIKNCPDGQYGVIVTAANQNNYCTECDAPCQTCFGQGNNSCLSCLGEYYQLGTTCVDNCPSYTIQQLSSCTCPPGQQFDQNNMCQNSSSGQSSYQERQQICNNARIPLDYVDLGEIGGVCVVREEVNPSINSDNNWNSYTCNQESFTGDDQFNDMLIPKTDACPTQLGYCDNTTGKCLGIQNSYYQEYFGREWNGVGTWQTVTMTTYGGSAACLGDVDTATNCVGKLMGLDGIAAVNPRMYGKWDTRSQSCVANNNVCYKITGPFGTSATIAVGGRCGGYGQCGPTEYLQKLNQVNSEPFDYAYLAQNLERLANVGWIDTNQCIYTPNCSIEAGITPSCIVQDPPTGKDGKSCCPGNCNEPNLLHLDWNDHPHFDLSLDAFIKICNATTGSCVAKFVEPVTCPDWKPNICLGPNVIKCPANSFQQPFEDSCIPTGQKLIKNGVYTKCCCESDSTPAINGTMCIKNSQAQNCSCQPHSNTTDWSALCSNVCDNYTACKEQSFFCQWIGAIPKNITYETNQSNSTPNSEISTKPQQNTTQANTVPEICSCIAQPEYEDWSGLCAKACNNQYNCILNNIFCQWNQSASSTDDQNSLLQSQTIKLNIQEKILQFNKKIDAQS